MLAGRSNVSENKKRKQSMGGGRGGHNKKKRPESRMGMKVSWLPAYHVEINKVQ